MQETKELNEGTGDEPKILTGIDVFLLCQSKFTSNV